MTAYGKAGARAQEESVESLVDRLTVLELADLVKQLEEKYGVSAAPPEESTATLARAREFGEAVDQLKGAIQAVAQDTGSRDAFRAVIRELTGLRTKSRLVVTANEERVLRARNATRAESLRGRVFGDSLSSDEVRAYIDRSRPIVNKMAKEGVLLGVPDGRAFRFPRWQFDAKSETGLVPGLQDVLASMDASPFRKAAWLISRNPALGNEAPLDVLRRGEVFRVIEEAKSLVGS